MRAIVLSGGGARGAYEMGVWKALRKLRIKYDIVTGTSVGAINGALMVQKTYNKSLKFWKKLNYDMIFEEKHKMKEKTKKEIMRTYANNFFLNGGMNVDKLENLLKNMINAKKIIKSKIDFGIVVVEFPTFKPKNITKKIMTEDNLADYIMASATCFPTFQIKNIDKKKYIDGGYYDNLPINLAIDLGATEAIVVDLKTVGLKKKAKREINTIYISPRNDIGSFLVFDEALAIRNIDYGYNDTMKTYGKLDGNIYTFKKNNLNKNYKKNISKFMINYGGKIIKEKKFNEAIEQLGKVFCLDEEPIYQINNYHKKIRQEFLKIKKIGKKFPSPTLNKNDNYEQKMIKYIYEQIKNNNEKEINKAEKIFPKYYLLALYLYVIVI